MRYGFNYRSSRHSTPILDGVEFSERAACRRREELPLNPLAATGEREPSHIVALSKQMALRPIAGYEGFVENGELLDAAEREEFAVLVTTDSNLKHQQSRQTLHIAIVALSTPSWPRIQRAIASVVRAIGQATAESYTEVQIP